MKISYADRVILTDPILSPKGAAKPFAGIARNPTVDLPLPVEKILEDVEMVLISHYHPDHFDDAAIEVLPKTIPVFYQPGDEERMTENGFLSVKPIETSHSWEGITFTRTGGQHGQGETISV